MTLWDVDTAEVLFTRAVEETEDMIKDIEVTPDGQRALLLTGGSPYRYSYEARSDAITVLDLGP